MLEPSKFSSPVKRPRKPTDPNQITAPLVLIVGALLIVGSLGFVGGLVTANAALRAERDRKFGVFFEAWDLVEREFYYDKPSSDERLRGAVNGMLTTLSDRYTLLIEPRAAAADSAVMSGETGGIGVRIAPTEDGADGLLISEVLMGAPASEAGILSGDTIVQVEGQPIKGLKTQDVIPKIRGAINSSVRLTIRRDARLLDFTLVRQQINVYGRMLNPQIAYVSLSLFDSKSTEQLMMALKPLLAQNPHALIFDLRGNPGGYLDQAVRVADLFLKEGLVVREKQTQGDNREFNAHTGELAEAIDLYVLVDGNSASASEIVAGALKDRGRALLIGQTTYGKGSVQSLYKLNDGSQLRITSGAWYTPNDTPIQGVGLPVNLYVETPAVFPPGTDPILDSAVDFIENPGREYF